MTRNLPYVQPTLPLRLLPDGLRAMTTRRVEADEEAAVAVPAAMSVSTPAMKATIRCGAEACPADCSIRAVYSIQGGRAELVAGVDELVNSGVRAEAAAGKATM
jgi:hypothetical protein